MFQLRRKDEAGPKGYFAVGLAVVQILGVIGIVHFFLVNHYLPAPFPLDKGDTFMDLFHSVFWASDPGRYTEWESVYPPLVFVILNGVSSFFLGNATFPDAFSLRAAGTGISIAFIVASVLCTQFIFASNLYRDKSLLEKWCYFLFFLGSMPFLFALERGNLVIFLPPLLAWALLSRGWGRVFAIALMINIKPYCALLLFADLIQARPIWFIRTVAVSGIIFLVTGMVCDASFILFIPGLLGFSSADFIFTPSAVLSMNASLTGFSYALDWDVAGNLGSPLRQEWQTLLSMGLRVGTLALVLAAIIGVVRTGRRLSQEQTLAVLVVIILNTSFSFGGYTFVLYAAIFPILATMRHGRLLCGLVILIFLPLDLISLQKIPFGLQDVFLSGRIVPVTLTVGLGVYVRPIADALILLTLVMECWGRKWALPWQTQPKLKMPANGLREAR
ncbi:hypothetical protein [Roseixanthobacter liquoris]|uniref:hypothetical protein n=1 Tax=Roseixanthobacter liquoris TaxID=3119921 RepID=UPI00372CD082